MYLYVISVSESIKVCVSGVTKNVSIVIMTTGNLLINFQVIQTYWLNTNKQCLTV